MSQSGAAAQQPATSIQFVIRTSDGESVQGFGAPGVVDFTVGRKSHTAVQDGHVHILDKYMSRRHCRIYWDDGQGAWCVQDLNSSNGTKIGGAALTEPWRLRGGEEIRVGTAVLCVHLYDSDGQPVDSFDPDLHDAGASEAGQGDDSTQAARTRAPHETGAYEATVALDAAELAGAGPATGARPDDDHTRFLDPAEDGETEFSSVMDDDRTVFSGKRADAAQAPADDAPADEDAGRDDETQVHVVADRQSAARAPVEATVPSLRRATGPSSAAADASTGSGTAAPTGAGGTSTPLTEPLEEQEARRAPTDTSALLEESAGADAPSPSSMQVATIAESSLAVEEAYRSEAPQLDSDVPAGIAGDPLVQALLKANLIDGYQIKDVVREAREQGQTFFRTYVESEDVRQHHGHVYGLVAHMRGLELIDDVDRLYDRAEDAHWLALELAERMRIVALRDRDDSALHYACADPYDLVVRDWVSQVTGRRAVAHLAFPTHLQLVIQRLRNRSSAGGEEHSIVAVDLTPEKEEEIREHLADADAPQIVDYFIHRASMQGASDIHIEPTEQRLVVRVRVDGVLHQDVALPAAYHAVVASRLKIMSGMDVAEKRRPQDGRIGVVVRGNPIDVRVSTYPTVYGEKVVMRLLDKNALRPSPETLGLLPRDLRVLKDAIQAPYGLIMLCGPTGSGKTTTLYSCLGAIDKNQKNVLTVEDPVEYRLAGVHQMQVNANIGLTFASGLRTILRQDPDVIMVGECRDSETASMAIQASLTGHVVFSTIHTNDAVGVVTRLIDMGIEPFLVGSSLSVAIAQRLVRMLCPDCKQSVSGEEVLARLKQDGVSAEKLAQLHIEVDPYLDYAEARGCRQCRNTGYIGRRSVFEVFEIDREIRSLISSPQFTDAALRDLALRRGMTTLVSHGLKLVEDENTTFAEVIRVLGETN